MEMIPLHLLEYDYMCLLNSHAICLFFEIIYILHFIWSRNFICHLVVHVFFIIFHVTTMTDENLWLQLPNKFVI